MIKPNASTNADALAPRLLGTRPEAPQPKRTREQARLGLRRRRRRPLQSIADSLEARLHDRGRGRVRRPPRRRGVRRGAPTLRPGLRARWQLADVEPDRPMSRR